MPESRRLDSANTLLSRLADRRKVLWWQKTQMDWLSRVPVEFMAVVAACRFPLSEEHRHTLESSFKSDFDWNLFLVITKRHRVTGNVHRALGQVQPLCVPLDVRHRLEQASHNLLRTNLQTAVAAVRLTNVLRQAGIEATMLKGVVLGSILFARQSIRHSKDIDLLVQELNVEAADAVLQQNGYVRQVPPQGWTFEEVSRFRAHRSHYEYLAAPDAPQVELHWRLHHNDCLGPATIGRTQVELGPGLSVWTLEEVDLLCYLCVHGALHGWSRLKWLVDVSTMLFAQPELAEQLVERSRCQGSLRAAGQALLLCRDLFNIPLPPSLGNPTFAMRVLHAAAKRILLVGSGAVEPANHLPAVVLLHLTHLLVGERKGYLLAEMRNKLLVPSAWEQRSRPARLAAPVRKLVHRLLHRG